MARVDPDDYVNNLIGPAAANRCQADTEPQLPASICVAMALKEAGFDTKDWGAYNVFNIRSTESGKTWREFGSIEEAVDAYFKNMKGGFYDAAIAKLKPKIKDSTQDDKMAYFSTLLPVYAPPSENDCVKYLADIVQFLNDYDLFRFDDPALAGKKIDPAIAKKYGALIGTGSNPAKSSDSGFTRQVMGEMVKLTKLPEKKTFCEPIYPDLLTVSDCVPKWVLDIAVDSKDTTTKTEDKDKDKDKSKEATASNSKEATADSSKDASKGKTEEKPKETAADNSKKS